MRGKILISALAASVVLSACSQSDMQGVDPQDYYSEHPIRDTVDTRHMLYTMDFTVDKNRLSGDDIDNFESAVRDIVPEAVKSVTVKLAPSQMNNEIRRQHIAKLLRAMGYKAKAIYFEASKDIPAREAALDITYAIVISARCPDWRTSPVTNYSNTYKGNFSCATTVNLGAMVADPHDLEGGDSDVVIDTPSAVTAIQDYRSGSLSAGATSAASSGASASGASSSGTSQ